MTHETSSIETLRQNVFANIYTLVNDNKPSGWTVLSSYPETTISSSIPFPFIIINSANVKPTIVGMDKNSYIVEDIKVEIEFFCKAIKGNDQLDRGRDNVMNTLLTKQSTLETYNLYLNEDAFDDSTTDVFVSGNEKIRTGASIVSMGLL